MMDCKASTSAAGNIQSRYEIFINHRGPDAKLKFVAHLADALRERGYSPFVDKYDLAKGGTAMEEIQAALEGASVQLAVLTCGYAESKYCLDELVDMLECCKRDPQKVKLVPIFLDVKPEHLRRPCDGPFKEAFEKHESRADGKEDEVERIERWKGALREAACRTGFELSGEAGDENVLKHKVVDRVEGILGLRVERKHLLTGHVVGLETTFAVATRELEKMKDKVAVLGIWGMGGIGKTTLAKRLYNHYLEQYELHKFVRKGGLREENVMGKDKDWFGKMSGRRVFVVMDDICAEDDTLEVEQFLQNLGSGSCVILTSRDQHIMKSVMRHAGGYRLLEMDVLNPEASYELFCYHAFGSWAPPTKIDDMFSVAKRVVECCGGLPLALEVIGKHLFEKEKTVWMEAAEILKNRTGILDKLSMSYDALTEGEQTMFLDVSCQMAGFLEDDAIHMWKSCEGRCWAPGCKTSRSVHDSLSILKDKALVKVDSWNRLTVHDLLREMGRKLAGRGRLGGRLRRLGKHSHLWNRRDAERVVESGKGTEDVRGLSLVGESSNRVFDASKFGNMREIHLLQLNRARIEGDFSQWSPNIRWLQWRWSSLTSLPGSLQLPYLIHLDLSGSKKLARLWLYDDTQVPRFLRVLDLFGCGKLEEISENIGLLTELKRLGLSGCKALGSLPGSFGGLTGLQELDLRDCKKLERLPDSIVNLCYLKRFVMDDCRKMTTLPEEFGKLRALVIFSAMWVKGLSCIPDSFAELSHLEELDLNGCEGLVKLPRSVKGLVKLRKLNLSLTAIKELPMDFGDLEYLVELNLGFCETLESLPESFGKLKRLKILYLTWCWSLRKLCSNFGQLQSLMNLDLSGCALDGDDLHGSLEGFSLSSLSLAGRCSIELSNPFSLAGSRLTRLSNCLYASTALVHSDLSYNEALVDVGSLPASLEELLLQQCVSLKGTLGLGNLTKLKKLMLRSCRGVTAVQGVEHMQGLEEIDVSGCWCLEEIDKNILLKSKVRKCSMFGSKVCLKYNDNWAKEEPSTQVVSYQYHSLPSFVENIMTKSIDLSQPYIDENGDDSSEDGDDNSEDGDDYSVFGDDYSMTCMEMEISILSGKKIDAIIIIIPVHQAEQWFVYHGYEIGAKIVRSGINVSSYRLFGLRHEEIPQNVGSWNSVGCTSMYICSLRRSHSLVKELEHGDKLCVYVKGDSMSILLFNYSRVFQRPGTDRGGIYVVYDIDVELEHLGFTVENL